MKKCKSCGIEIETNYHSSTTTINVDYYCECCNESDTSITVNQLASGDDHSQHLLSLCADTSMSNFLSASTCTLIPLPQQEEITSVTSSTNHCDNRHFIINIENNVNQYQCNDGKMATIDRTGLPTYDTAIRLAEASRTRGLSSQIEMKNANLDV